VSLTYQLILNRNAIKFVAKQERAIQERIRRSLTGLVVRPPVGDIKPLKGKRNLMRLRVGTYRVIFEVNHTERIVYILSIDNRGDSY
jgi:mRNA-degrading endonuclease RelE of RelBE toxin-antitoxin system